MDRLVQCAICRKIEYGFKHFADAGWACRRCVTGATRIVTVYTIEGKAFREIQKDHPIRIRQAS